MRYIRNIETKNQITKAILQIFNLRVYQVAHLSLTPLSSKWVAVRHTPLTAMLHPMYASSTAFEDLIVSSTPSPTDPSHMVIALLTVSLSTVPTSCTIPNDHHRLMKTMMTITVYGLIRKSLFVTSTIPENIILTVLPVWERIEVYWWVLTANCLTIEDGPKHWQRWIHLQQHATINIMKWKVFDNIGRCEFLRKDCLSKLQYQNDMLPNIIANYIELSYFWKLRNCKCSNHSSHFIFWHYLSSS